MTPVETLRLRSRRLTRGATYAAGDYVLVWLMQALRADDNPVLDAADALAARLGKPLVVVHTLETTYPYASHRLHRFILEATQSLEADLAARGRRFVRYLRRAGGEPSLDVVARLAARAAAVVVDDVPTFVTREFADALAARLTDRAVVAVDACCSVPMNAFPHPLVATKAFRAAHTPHRAHHLGTPTAGPRADAYAGDLDLETEPLAGLDAAALDARIAETGVDASVPPAPGFRGHRQAALAQLAHAVEHVVPRYNWARTNPTDPAGASRLSPWMHFGVLGPREVAQAVLDAEAEGRVHASARWKFLDELLTWREWTYHRCRHEPGWARYGGLPAWARETMEAHADDPRPALLSLDALVHGETGDETWDAAQKQFLLDGWMHNNLRMVWVKQILKWRPDPADAFAVACYLNDRFSLDGRDAATYGGIRWGFGDAAPGYREVPVYGRVATKGDAAVRKRAGVPEWLADEARRPPEPRAAIPADEAAAFARYL